MAHLWHISMPESEKELAEWLNEKIRRNEISASAIFRDAIRERKQQEDIMNASSIKELMEENKAMKERIDNLRLNLQKYAEFVDKRGLFEEFQEIQINEDKPKRKEVIG